MKQIYQIQGMHCASCAGKIKSALQGFAETVEVSFNPPQLILNSKTSVNLKALNAALAIAGKYTLIPLENPSIETSPPKRHQKGWIQIYYPLLMILGIISVASFAGAQNFHEWMLHFMAAFFLVFGAFKLLDLRGFQEAYATYDLLAKYWKGYGYIYPFIEMGLGFAFLFQFWITQALWFSLILMGFSSLGVIQALFKKQIIRCACLGTAINLPMSTITLVEDFGMIIMTIAMLA